MVERILGIHPNIRYVGIVDNEYHLLESRQREGIDSIAPEQVERNFISIVPPIIVDAVRKLEPYCGTTRTVSIRYDKLLLIFYQTEAKTPFLDKIASDLGKIVRDTEDQP
jgi:hypothetical protein